MTPNQKALRYIDDELEGIETRSAEIVSGESITDEMDVPKSGNWQARKRILLERRSAVRLLLDDDDRKSVVHDLHGMDNQTARAAWSCSGKSRLTNFFMAAVQGKEVTGAELELRQAAGVDGIPLEIFDTPDELEKRVDATTGGIPGQAVSA